MHTNYYDIQRKLQTKQNRQQKFKIAFAWVIYFGWVHILFYITSKIMPILTFIPRSSMDNWAIFNYGFFAIGSMVILGGYAVNVTFKRF